MKQVSLLILFASFSLVSLAQKADSTMKTWLGVLTLTEKYADEKNWTASEQGIVGEHFQRLKKLKDEGLVILAGRTDYEVSNPEMLGLVIFYARDEGAAKQFMADDPAVRNKIMNAKVHPYALAIFKCDN